MLTREEILARLPVHFSVVDIPHIALFNHGLTCSRRGPRESGSGLVVLRWSPCKSCDAPDVSSFGPWFMQVVFTIRMPPLTGRIAD